MRWLLLAAGLVLDGPAHAQPPVLVGFVLRDSAGVVHLQHRVVGVTPTHYRVSPRADFEGARWEPYVPRPSWHPAGHAGPPCGDRRQRLRLFLQVRALLGSEVRIVAGQRTLVPTAVESNVVADSLCLGG